MAMADFTSNSTKHHPLIAFIILLLFITPVLPIVILLLPFLICFLVCGWSMARLMRAGQRSRNRRRRRRSRSGSRYMERKSEEEEEGWLQWAREGFESERQMRVNEYLEDQLKNLFALRNGTLQEDLVGACDCDPVEDQALANGEYEGKIRNDILPQDRGLKEGY
ncbi:hypothetical protein O6H91_12G009000 [Diphasiastrum complanatum]|uniref:Uncharacterized protein n=1 Tax=Diphasiastrum complanatum TaxID=34168 RepID=A0ACC2BYV8_DIPCM|nr:hypothetical protein O6H91_12G009000 [Diphasiastrum complanatum]